MEEDKKSDEHPIASLKTVLDRRLEKVITHMTQKIKREDIEKYLSSHPQPDLDAESIAGRMLASGALDGYENAKVTYFLVLDSLIVIIFGEFYVY